MKKRFLTSLQLLICLLCALPCYTAYGSRDQPFLAGSQLPQFTLPVPESQQTLSYLGLRTMDPFTISQTGAKLVLIRVPECLMSQCQANAPVLNRLYNEVQKDAALAKDVKIIGIAIGNSKRKQDAFKRASRCRFQYFLMRSLSLATPCPVLEHRLSFWCRTTARCFGATVGRSRISTGC